MANGSYIQGRRQYQRPQAMLWADNPGTIVTVEGSSFYVPTGNEIGSAGYDSNDPLTRYYDEPGEFIILSDDNRQNLDFKSERIEQRKRMINGRMRSYHIADKLTLSTSWTMLPSRASAFAPEFEQAPGLSTPVGKSNLLGSELYTTDSGAGGVELLDWYERHQGSFWVYLAYDKYSVFGKDDVAYGNMVKYNQVIEVFFSDFNYAVVKRGGSLHDFWDISVALEEV